MQIDSTKTLSSAQILVLDMMCAEQSFDQRRETHQCRVSNVPVLIFELFNS